MAKLLNFIFAMNAINPQSLPDRVLGAIISGFGLSYFTTFLLQFLLFHFPSSPEDIPEALSVIVFGVGLMLWYLGVFPQRNLSWVHERLADQHSILQAGALLLIWVVAVPTIVFVFPAHPWLQLGYTSALAVTAIGSLPQKLLCHVNHQKCPDVSSIHLASVLMLSLTPTIHALAEPAEGASPLAVAFSRMVITGSLSFAFYFLQPLERLGFAKAGQLSLHGMHMMLTYGLVAYSKSVLVRFCM